MNSIENEKLQQMNTPNGGYRLKEAVKAMINYGSPILVQFPRVEKYGLAKRIRETMYDMLHLCNVIQKKYYKRDTLREFDTLLLDLRDYLDEAANPRLYPQGTEPKKKAQEAGGRSSTGSPAAACHLHHDAPIRDMEQIYRGNRRNDRQLHEVCGGQAVQIGLLAFLHNRGLTIIYASRSGAAAGTTLPTRAFPK